MKKWPIGSQFRSSASSHNNPNQNLNSNNQSSNKKNPKNNKKEIDKAKKLKEMKEKELEEQKKENQLEDEIRDHLKCYICLGKVSRPKMCKYCKKICCSACIDQWLQDHSFCGICKHQVTQQDMISLPFLDDMSTFFINNIDNQKKKGIDKSKTSLISMGKRVISGQNVRINNNINNLPSINYMNNHNINININSNIDNNISNNEDLNEIIDTEEAELDENVCQEHGENISYYCIQCDKYFCSKCLVFFGEETKKHKNHFIVQVTKINDLGVTQAIKEYKKLGETKNKLNDIIGRINMLKKEKEIRKYEVINIIDFIREYNKIRMDEEVKKYQDIINYVRNQKLNVENISMALPNELNMILNQNDINKAQEIFNKINVLNNTNNNISAQFLPMIQSPSYQTQDIFIDTYQTDFITKKLNINSDISDNCEIINIPINLIPHHSSNFGINFTNGNFGIYLVVNTREDVKSLKYPVFNAYIIFRGLGYCLEFLTLKNEYLEKKRSNVDFGNNKFREQINRVELDKDRFLFLCDNDYNITYKICVVKLSYK